MFSTKFVQEVVEFCRPKNVNNFDVFIKNSNRIYSGTAYIHPKHIIVRIGGEAKFPIYHKYNGNLNSNRFPIIQLNNYNEVLVYVVAHEIRHIWQSIYHSKKQNEYFAGSKGKYSELDAEMYAKILLEIWQNRN